MTRASYPCNHNNQQPAKLGDMRRKEEAGNNFKRCCFAPFVTLLDIYPITSTYLISPCLSLINNRNFNLMIQRRLSHHFKAPNIEPDNNSQRRETVKISLRKELPLRVTQFINNSVHQWLKNKLLNLEDAPQPAAT